ncbi:DUF5677 domain-containing protein [Paenibacillus polymyxa]|uniref:DUF5677 domain-containing protein n=1 Tax=Paenibacillus polymyxa TaxID=1406 RepID=UPI0003D32F88|nr:DUF5677 domain-containing protein [Paenibacillus polymyxa]AIW40950.1 hypothetical protein X809_33645 [Paenibacillus polymyxa CR1]
MNLVQETLMKLARQASLILHDYYVLTSAYFNKDLDISENHRYVLKQLPVSCQLTSESSLVLIANLRLWDNEMLLRSIMEGTIKFVHLTLGTNEERESKINEFWEVLPAISEIKRTKRAKALVDSLPEPLNSDMVFIKDVILDDEIMEELEKRYPRKFRKEVEQRWSYSEIVKELSQHPLYSNLNGMFHSYGIGSQLIHQDANAINLLIDHNSRSADRREAKELAHGCRQISDIITFAAMRYFAYSKLYNEDIEKLFLESFDTLNNEMEVFHQLFRDIEDKYKDV